MPVVVHVTRVVHPHVDEPRLAALPTSARCKRAREVLGEEREHVDAHRRLRLTGRAGLRAVRRRPRPALCSTTNTIGMSGPPSSTSRSCAGFASTDATVPEHDAAAIAHLRADQLVHPDLAGGASDRDSARRPSHRAAFGPVAIVDAGEAHEVAALVRARRLDHRAAVADPRARRPARSDRAGS